MIRVGFVHRPLCHQRVHERHHARLGLAPQQLRRQREPSARRQLRHARRDSLTDFFHIIRTPPFNLRLAFLLFLRQGDVPCRERGHELREHRAVDLHLEQLRDPARGIPRGHAEVPPPGVLGLARSTPRLLKLDRRAGRAQLCRVRRVQARGARRGRGP